MTGDRRLVAWGDELIKLHDGFRRDLAALRAGLRGPGGGELRTHCLAFCDALHAHHEGEDATLFPHLAAGHPDLAEVLRRLGAEHRVVAGSWSASGGCWTRKGRGRASRTRWSG
ncbi:hemerythrin domain-containing protein [Nonomuraea bangladeshensis]|uniref:hemerythrin domain-containing protein n=1 Tax=Nonomuraea bangladeshensis TaxID=404385 RepID=UPI003C2F1174